MIVITEPVTTGGKSRMSVDDQQALRPPTVGQPDRDHRGDRGEGHALQQRQPDADLPEPDGLDDRGDAAGEQVGVDEVDQLLGGEPDRVGEQDRDDHRAGVERQHVLEPVDRELGCRQDLVHGMPGNRPVSEFGVGGHGFRLSKR
jgi:hypothetical protein